MDEVVNNLKKALECPCCLEPPKPNPTAVGLCSNGHLACEPCTVSVLQVADVCPVCRKRDFKVVRGHYLAVSVIQILTACLIYSCKHNNCSEQKNGNEIAQHEATCALKPIKCPKSGCNHASPIDFFMRSLHFSCVELVDVNLEDNTWNMMVVANLIFSFDHDMIRLSSMFRPIVLRGTTSTGYVSHAYINAKVENGALIFYPCWLNTRDYLEDKYKQLKITLFVYINTPFGQIGQYTTRFPVFEGQEYEHQDDGINIPKHLFYNWLKWSTLTFCTECASPRVYLRPNPHLHIKVSFEENQS